MLQEALAACEVCKKPIQWFCASCNQWFCNDCKQKHTKFKATRAHSLQHVTALAREHRSNLHSIQTDLKRGTERLTIVSSASETHQNRVKEMEAEALRELEQSRDEFVNLINERFDEIENKIVEFSEGRRNDLEILKLRSQTLLVEVKEQTEKLEEFLTKPQTTLVTRGGRVTSELSDYMSMTSLPRVEFKEYFLNFKRGTKFVPKAVGSYEMRGGFTQVNVPIQLKNILKQGDKDIAPSIPAPKQPAPAKAPVR